MIQEEQEDDDLMIPLNLSARLAPFVDRYFVRSYLDDQYYFQHSNKYPKTQVDSFLQESPSRTR